MLNPIIIHHRSAHHAKNAGYSRIADYLYPKDVLIGRQILPYKAAKIISGFFSNEKGNYDTLSVQKDIELFSILRKSNINEPLVHYLNAERDIRFVHRYKKNSVKVTGTFHKPPSILKEKITNNRYLKRLNGAIAVGVNQVDFLKNWLDLENVQYIPHGIDTEFFKPNDLNKKDSTLLFVGQHLRDFETLNYCIPRIAEKFPTLEVNIIIRKDFFKKVKPHKSIKLISGLDDFELRKKYQEATLLFLPLLDATACNSILEAMACGLPIVTTAVGGNSSYLKDTNCILTPNLDKDALVDAVISLLDNDSKRAEISKLTRTKALHYEWSKVATEIHEFYQTLK